MTIGVPVAADPDAVAAAGAGLLADVPAAPVVLSGPGLLLPPLLLQAATPPASASVRNAVAIGLCLIPVSWRMLCVQGEDLLLVKFARGAGVDDPALAEQVDGRGAGQATVSVLLDHQQRDAFAGDVFEECEDVIDDHRREAQ